MDKKKLDEITRNLIENYFRNEEVIYSDNTYYKEWIRWIRKK